MMRPLISQLLVVATLVVSSFAVPETLAVEDITHPQCPFNVVASIAEDGSYLDIVYSTKGTTPNSLAAHGPGVKTLDSQRKCYVVITISHNDLDVARMTATGAQITGKVRLDEGLVAQVETSLVLNRGAYSLVHHPKSNNDGKKYRADHGLQMNFTTASVTGPQDGDFAHRASLTSPALHAECHSPKKLTLVSVFSVSAQSSSVPGSATGELVKEGSLRKRFFLKWTEMCDVGECRFIDRYGNVVFRPPYDEETCPE
jgi:hypothetical protein